MKIDQKHYLAKKVAEMIQTQNVSIDAYISPELITNDVGETIIVLNQDNFCGDYTAYDYFVSQRG